MRDRKSIKAAAAAAACAAYIAVALGFSTTTQFPFRLAWQAQPSPNGMTNYQEPSNWCFNIYQTTNLGTASSNWPLGFVVTNWSLGPITAGPNGPLQWYTSPPAVYPPGQYFFVCVVSNSNGEVGPSNPAFNPPWPGQAANLGILVTNR